MRRSDSVIIVDVVNRGDMTLLQRLEAICPLFVGMAKSTIRAEKALAQDAARRRAAGVGVDGGRVGDRDFGPGIRVRRKEVLAEFRADPDPAVGALVRGGRVRDGLLMMYRGKHIKIQQFNAGRRFRDDVDMANGAACNRPDSLGIRSPFRGSMWPGDVQMLSMDRVRQVNEELDPVLVDVLDKVVIRGLTGDEYARLRHIRRERVTERLRLALDALVKFYDGKPELEGVG